MSDAQLWSWIVMGVGVIGFYFAGKKLWWSWYIGLAGQILWTIYAIVSSQPAFLVSVVVYTIFYSINAYKWTREHFAEKWLATTGPSLRDYEQLFKSPGIISRQDLGLPRFYPDPMGFDDPLDGGAVPVYDPGYDVRDKPAGYLPIYNADGTQSKLAIWTPDGQPLPESLHTDSEVEEWATMMEDGAQDDMARTEEMKDAQLHAIRARLSGELTSEELSERMKEIRKDYSITE